MSKKKKPKKPAHRPPERVSSDLPWEEAVQRALGKKKPKDGWPKAKDD